MITPLPDAVLRSRLLPLIDHPDPDVVRRAALAAERAGAPTVEIGLRHGRSLEALRAAVESVSIPVGAGTVVDPDDVVAARRAGAAYLVSPGSTPSLIAAVVTAGAPWLPGAATPSEVLSLRDAGAGVLKIFPAGVLGGPVHLRALSAVVDGVGLVPTGGIDADSAPAYLDVPGVVAVGGSWMFSAAATDDSGADVEAAVAAALDVVRPG
ncbi:MAG: bifunctional 4-hydroxy-2-oxoglutarate aldolase/2-dehydro-3-deoxy-phosphogluconate aldolase [Actinomycetota bacterium]